MEPHQKARSAEEAKRGNKGSKRGHPKVQEKEKGGHDWGHERPYNRDTGAPQTRHKRPDNCWTGDHHQARVWPNPEQQDQPQTAKRSLQVGPTSEGRTPRSPQDEIMAEGGGSRKIMAERSGNTCARETPRKDQRGAQLCVYTHREEPGRGPAARRKVEQTHRGAAGRGNCNGGWRVQPGKAELQGKSLARRMQQSRQVSVGGRRGRAMAAAS
ncbi:unnamed protein product [Calypogeia fissa]